MSNLKVQIARIGDNIDRLDTYINQYGSYETVDNVHVETLPSFMSRISSELAEKVNALEESASTSAHAADLSAKKAMVSEQNALESSMKAYTSEEQAKLHAVRLESNMIPIIEAYLSRLFPQGSFLDIFNAEGMDLNDPSLTNSPFANERLVSGAYSLSIGDGKAIDLMGGEK